MKYEFWKRCWVKKKANGKGIHNNIKSHTILKPQNKTFSEWILYTYIYDKSIKTWLGRIYINSRRVVPLERERREWNEKVSTYLWRLSFNRIGLTMTNLQFVIFGWPADLSQILPSVQISLWALYFIVFLSTEFFSLEFFQGILLYFILFFCRVARGILVPRSGIKLAPSAL